MEAEIQLPLGRALFLRSDEITQSVAAPESILRFVKLAGSIELPARAILQRRELEANATRASAVSVMVKDPACVDRSGFKRPAQSHDLPHEEVKVLFCASVVGDADAQRVLSVDHGVRRGRDPSLVEAEQQLFVECVDGCGVTE